MADLSPPKGKKGIVYLVGAGPGDPGLITLRGIECLQLADVVLYDYLVNPIIMQHALPNAERICLGKHGGTARRWTQDAINKRLVELASAGKNVVRLKGGDPAVFARAGEEVAFLAEHDIPVEIVPGITTALAAGSHAGISITHRDLASAVALVTGRERPGKAESDLDFDALARFPGTLVFYMGVTTVSQWSRGLLKGGMAPETPVALVRRCSRHDQQTLRSRLDEVEERLTPRSKFPPPVIAIVGAVADQPQLTNWFADRPLFGQTVAVTRPAEQARELGHQLQTQGARVVYQPAIEIRPPADPAAMEKAFADLSSFDWVVFSSGNGVRHFFSQLRGQSKDARAFGGAQIASVGPATTAALGEFSIQPELQPDKFDGDSLAADLVSQIAVSEKSSAETKVLLVRADRGRDVLANTLRDANVDVEEVAFYESHDVIELSDDFSELWSAGEVDWITVTSSAIARSLVSLLGKDALSKCKIASISPLTSATLTEHGLAPTVQAEPYTMPDLVRAILAAQG